MDVSRCDAVSRTLKFSSIQWIALKVGFVLIFPSKEKKIELRLQFLTPSNNCA